MLKRLKRSWSTLKRGRPGSRFQEQYDRQREQGSNVLSRAIRIGAGLIALPVGLFLLPAPGPGTIVIVLGAVLLAREFRVVAQLLDGFEVRGRRVMEWAKRVWRRSKRVRASDR